MENSIAKMKMIEGYVNSMVDGLKHSYPYLTEKDLIEAIVWSIDKNLVNKPAFLDNNYTKRRMEGTLLDVMAYIEKMQPIVTSSGVLFKRHKEADNPLSKMIMGFLQKRSQYKKEMFKYPKGSYMYEKYNLLQLLEKINANGTYGVLGNANSLFYNIYVAEAITRQGRSYISCSIMLFESLLSNNVKFNSLNEVITFMNNVVNEKPNRKIKDFTVLDRDITREECFFKIMNTADMMIWMPTEKEMQLVWEYIVDLSQEDINRIYYKNNLYTFCDCPAISNIIINILCKLQEPFMDPNKAPKEVEDDLALLVSYIKEYVYYPHFYVDKLDRIEYMQRDIVCISDTDSTIISFDAWYRYVLGKVYNIDMKIKHEKRDLTDMINEYDSEGNRKPVLCKYIKSELDYNFYTDEVIELEKVIEPNKLIPQDSLRYSIINLMGYICSDLVVDYLNEYTKLTGSYDENMKCRMIMKNEFLFSRVLLTVNRRNYADLQVLQEGNIIPEDKRRMAIMGLPINKSTLSESVKKEMQDILYEDILTADSIDQIRIIKKLAILEKQIFDNIMSKKTDFYKPDNVAPISSYEAPMSQNGCIAEVIYNAMRSEDMPQINVEERNKIMKIKLNLSKKNAEKIKDKYPEDYARLIAMLNHPVLGKLDNYTLGLPIDVTVPDWALEFVDIQAITSDVLNNFPLESIGLQRMDNDNVNYSNIIKL